MTVSAEEFARLNRQRVEIWHPGFPNDGWTGADWSNAMVGEAGEAANEVKKLRRIETNLTARGDTLLYGARLRQLEMEVGDTYTYLDLLCQFYQIANPLLCAQVKFNIISKREGIDIWMPEPS